MVFVRKPQRCSAYGINVKSEDLSLTVTNHFLFSTQQMFPSHVVSMLEKIGIEKIKKTQSTT
jgi:hypothetical protein